MDYIPVPAFQDNYIWVVSDGQHAVVVDPGEAAPVIAYLRAQRLRLCAILLTHHHADHVGGVAELLASEAGAGAAAVAGGAAVTVPVYGPTAEAIPTVRHGVAGGDTVRIEALDMTLSVLDVPGHTRGHIAYFLAAAPLRGAASASVSSGSSSSTSSAAPQTAPQKAPQAAAQPEAQSAPRTRDSAGAPHLFCGDTLFASGCGRLFEGTPQQMLHSLDALAALPDATWVHCAHEYTLANLKFALACEPDNVALQAWQRDAETLRARGLPTLPTTLAHEHAVNPFLRADRPEIVARLAQEFGDRPADRLASFTRLREWKNRFA
jgi:hydroxyacylglutathione hydrolase